MTSSRLPKAPRPAAPLTGVLSRYPEPGEASVRRWPDSLRGTPLGVALDPSRNSLNALRLVFAGAVIISHAWWLGGYGPEPALYGIKLGTAGVMGFFAISGYLITLSADHSESVAEFAMARFTRIYPGLLVAALTVAFVAAPVGAAITGGHYDPAGAAAFLGAALTLSVGALPTPPIGTSLQGNYDPLDWNGPLWTLLWETVCYVIAAVVVMAARRSTKGGNPAIATLFLFGAVSGGVAIKVVQGGFGPGRADFALPLMTFFLAGSLLAHFRDRVPVGAVPLAVALPIACASLASSLAPVLVPLPLAYLVLCLGSLRTLSRIGSRYDVSYGVYIYGWPVQQLLAALHVPNVMPPLGYAALAIISVWPLAFLSCMLVEQPTQRWRRARRTRHSEKVV